VRRPTHDTTPTPPPIAPILGRYQLGEPLGAGGMARVFAARSPIHTSDPPELVIKRMHPHLASNPRFIAMFVHEARVSTRLAHPNIVKVIDFEATDRGLYLLMEYVDGPDLLEVLKRCAERAQPMPPTFAALILSYVLEALDYAHGARHDNRRLEIVHRDVSPSNILLSWRGQVKLADFGIARAADSWSEVDPSRAAVGKYGYMSPEQLAGHNIDGRSDVFAAGVVLAELLICRRVYTAESDLELLSMVSAADTWRFDAHSEHIAPDLRAICNKAMSYQRGDRFTTAGEFRDALIDWMLHSPVRTGALDLARYLESLELK
jgi:serine/threonine-protein kinase